MKNLPLESIIAPAPPFAHTTKASKRRETSLADSLSQPPPALFLVSGRVDRRALGENPPLEAQWLFLLVEDYTLLPLAKRFKESAFGTQVCIAM